MAYVWRYGGDCGGGYGNCQASDLLTQGHHAMGGDVYGQRITLDGGNVWYPAARGRVGNHIQTRAIAFSNRTQTAGTVFWGTGNNKGSWGSSYFAYTPAGDNSHQIIDNTNGFGSGYTDGHAIANAARRAHGDMIYCDCPNPAGTEWIFTITPSGLHRYTNSGSSAAAIGAPVNLCTNASFAGSQVIWADMCWFDLNHLLVVSWDRAATATATAAIIGTRMWMVTSSTGSLRDATALTTSVSAVTIPSGVTASDGFKHVYEVTKGNDGHFYAAAGYKGVWEVTRSGNDLTWANCNITHDILVSSVDAASDRTLWVGQAGGNTAQTNYDNDSTGTPPGHAIIKGTFNNGSWTSSYPASTSACHFPVYQPGDGAVAHGPIWFLSTQGHVGLAQDAYDCSQIRVDPFDNNIIMSTGRSGEWQSRDNGQNWYPAQNGLNGAEVGAVNISTTNHNKVSATGGDWVESHSTDTYITVFTGSADPQATIGTSLSGSSGAQKNLTGLDGASYTFTASTGLGGAKLSRAGVDISNDLVFKGGTAQPTGMAIQADGTVYISTWGGVLVGETGTAPLPATPNFTTTPSDPTSSTSATFTWTTTDTDATETFEWSLDGSAYTNISTTKTKTLTVTAGVSHTFKVRGRNANGVSVTPASFTWAVTVAPPTPTLSTTGTDPTLSTTRVFTFSDTQVGVLFDAHLETGATFDLTNITSPYTVTTAPGNHTFTLQARNATGQISSSVANSWTQNAAPSVPAVTCNIGASGSSTTATSATFTWTDPDASVTFNTILDGGAAQINQTSPKSYTSLALGAHTFVVRAVRGSDGATADSATYTWTVTSPSAKPVLQAPDDGIPYRSMSGQLHSTIPSLTVALQVATMVAYWSGNADASTDKAGGFGDNMLDPAQTVTVAGKTYTGDAGLIISKYDKLVVEQDIGVAPTSMRVTPNATLGGGRNVMQPQKVVAAVNGWTRYDDWHGHMWTLPDFNGVNNRYAGTNPYRSVWFDTAGPESTLGQQWWAGNQFSKTAGTAISDADWVDLCERAELRVLQTIMGPACYIAVNGVRGGGTNNAFANLAIDSDQSMWEGWTSYGIQNDNTARMLDAQFVTSCNAALAVQQKGSNFEGLCYLPGGGSVTAGGANLRAAQEYEVGVAMLARNDSNGGRMTFQMVISGGATDDPWTTGELLNPLYLSFRQNGDPNGASRLGNPVDHWFAIDAAYPTGGRIVSGTGGWLYQRKYANGFVLVNTATVSLTSTLDARNYLDLFTGASVGSSVTVAAGEARFLVSSGVLPATPTFTATPTNPTSSTSATFTWTTTDNDPAETFEWSIDGGAYTALALGIQTKTLTVTAGANHTFRVRGRNTVGVSASPAAYTWTVNPPPPPTPTLATSGTDPTTSTTRVFTFSDTQPSCTFDAHLENTSLFDGSVTGSFHNITSPFTVTTVPGNHVFTLRAVDNIGQPSAANATNSWTQTNLPPPTAPTVSCDVGVTGTSTTATSATFTWSDPDPGLTFDTKLDTAAFVLNQTSPKTVSALALGAHTFVVRAVRTSDGQTANSTTYGWTVITTPPPKPTLSSLVPNSGSVGTSVVITGTNLTGATSVTFNGVSANFTVNSSTQITATVPAGAGTGPCSVTTPGGSASLPFTVTGIVADGLLKINGSAGVWTVAAWQPGVASGSVYAVAVSGTNVIVGGNFTQTHPQGGALVTHNQLWSFNKSTGANGTYTPSWSLVSSGIIRSIALSADLTHVAVCGGGSGASGQALVVTDTSGTRLWSHTADGTVLAAIPFKGGWIIVGQFGSVAPSATVQEVFDGVTTPVAVAANAGLTRAGIAMLNTDGTNVTTWGAPPYLQNQNGQSTLKAVTLAAAQDGSRVYVGGDFTQIQSTGTTAQYRFTAFPSGSGSFTYDAFLPLGDLQYPTGYYNDIVQNYDGGGA